MPPRWKFSRIDDLPPYVFSLLLDMKAKALARGEDIIDLGMGNPDLPSAPIAVEKLCEDSRDPANHRYAPGRGKPELRQAICQWYERRFHVHLDPEKEVMTTLGAKPGLAHLLISIVSPGDRVLVPNPYYPIHHYAVKIASGKPVDYPIEGGQNLSRDFFPLLQKEKPKVIILNFPHNPTTTTVDLSFFEQVIDFARKSDAIVIHDFAYGDLVFDGYRAPSILEVPKAKDVCVEFYSMSKGFSMAGWRVGFCLGNPELICALERMKSYLDYGIFIPIQSACVEALTKAGSVVDGNILTYQKRRDVLVKALQEADWLVSSPKATMFVWAKIPEKFRALGSLEFAKKVLNEAKVVISPGICFGQNGEGYVRFSLVEPDSRLLAAARNIQKLL